MAFPEGTPVVTVQLRRTDVLGTPEAFRGLVAPAAARWFTASPDVMVTEAPVLAGPDGTVTVDLVPVDWEGAVPTGVTYRLALPSGALHLAPRMDQAGTTVPLRDVLAKAPVAGGDIIYPAGPAGPSPYDLAVANGYQGTEVDWLASLAATPDDVAAVVEEQITTPGTPTAVSLSTTIGATVEAQVGPAVESTVASMDVVTSEGVSTVVAAEVTARDLLTKPVADTAYAPFDQVKEAMLLQRARMAKGGSIGIGDKAAIAIRFDDWHAAFKANAFAMMTARGLPAGYATISRLDQQNWTAGVTEADLVTWNRNGIEFHSHGTDHKDPSPGGYAGLVDQIVNSKAEIEAFGGGAIKCQGWMQPGATPVGPDVPYGTTFQDLGSLYTPAGQLIRQTYPVSEMYLAGIVRQLPSGMYHGLDHVTPSDGMTYAAAQGWVITAVADKMGVEMMFHSGNIGKPGNITWAEFEALLDYICEFRDNGELEVLTPSGMHFADHGTSRLNLVEAAPFERMETGTNLPGWSGVWTGKTIETGDARTGTKFLRYGATVTNMLNHRSSNLQTVGCGGETFVIEAWVRSNGTGTTVSRVLVTDYDDTTRMNLNLTRIGIGPEWTKIRHAITLHPATDRLSVAIGRNSGDGIDFDDLAVWKV